MLPHEYRTCQDKVEVNWGESEAAGAAGRFLPLAGRVGSSRCSRLGALCIVHNAKRSIGKGLRDAPTVTWNWCMNRPQQRMGWAPHAKRVRMRKTRSILFAPFGGVLTRAFH